MGQLLLWGVIVFMACKEIHTCFASGLENGTTHFIEGHPTLTRAAPRAVSCRLESFVDVRFIYGWKVKTWNKKYLGGITDLLRLCSRLPPGPP